MATITSEELAAQVLEIINKPLVEVAGFQEQLSPGDLESLEKISRLYKIATIQKALAIAYESGVSVGRGGSPSQGGGSLPVEQLEGLIMSSAS